MKKLEVKVQKRKTFGRKVKNLRTEGVVPANIFGKKIKSTALRISLKEFLDIFKEAGETGVVYLTIEGEKESRPVLISNVQKSPVFGDVLHVEFRQVDLTEKVEVAVPVELVGEAPAVDKGGIVVHLLDEIKVEALPNDLPDKIEVDISGLEEIGKGITVKDLKINREKIKVLDDENQLVVQIEEPTKEEEPAPPAPAEGEEGEGEVEEGETKEGEEPKEGETPPLQEGKSEKSKEASTSGETKTKENK